MDRNNRSIKRITRDWLKKEGWKIHERPVWKALSPTGEMPTDNPNKKIDNGVFLKLKPTLSR